MSLSPTAAAAAIARPRWSSSRDIPTTCAACKHRAEAQGESRHATQDRRRAREGLRFDGTLPRTSRSLIWMKSEAPTSLETELDLIGHLVAASVSLCARRERYALRLQSWWPQTTADALAAAGRRSWLRPSRNFWSAATTAGGEESRCLHESSHISAQNIGYAGPPYCCSGLGSREPCRPHLL
jgi:hypothetical protein